MKTKIETNRLLLSSLALAMAMASCLPITATAADEPTKPMKEGEHKMMKDCQAMKEKKEKMMSDMKAKDVELTAQVAKMNGAPEDKKLDLTAAVVTQMVEQRTAMTARMAKMQEEMMKHMMEHMAMGKESMAQCPMMKGMKAMKDTDEKSPDAHNEHHTEQK